MVALPPVAEVTAVVAVAERAKIDTIDALALCGPLNYDGAIATGRRSDGSVRCHRDGETVVARVVLMSCITVSMVSSSQQLFLSVQQQLKHSQ